MTQAQYIDRQSRLMNTIARVFVGKVNAALRYQVSSFTDDIKEIGLEQARRRMEVFLLNGMMARTLKELYVRAALPIARERYYQLRKTIEFPKNNAKGLRLLTQPSLELKRFGFNDKWTTEVQQFFDRYLLNKVVIPITETTREMIAEVLEKAIAEGWGVDKIVSYLNSPDFTKWRARMIVRTEAARATNYASMLAASEFDYEMQKNWIEVKDNRTRRTHRHATGVGGEVKDFYERYSNGLMFPGDPNGSAKEVINCRCVQGVKPKRDDKGRLIPLKHKIPLNVMLGMAEWNRSTVQ